MYLGIILQATFFLFFLSMRAFILTNVVKTNDDWISILPKHLE